MENSSVFKKKYTLEQRKGDVEAMLKKHPDRIPVIVEINLDSNSTNKISLSNNKFLVPNDLTVSKFLFVLRKKIQITSEMGIFLFVNNILPNTADTMGALYENHKDEDGYLYAVLSAENTFG